jgi:5-keto-L-gluconate epimerase
MNNKVAIAFIEDAKKLTPIVLRGNIEAALNSAREYGYDLLEIHVIDPKGFNCNSVKNLCTKYSVGIAAIVTGQTFVRRGLYMTAKEKEIRVKAIEEIKGYLDIAECLEAKDGVIVGWVKGNRPEEDDGIYDELLATGLSKIAEYSIKNGQRINVEVINRYETNVFNTIEETMDFITRYGLTNVYIHADAFHMNIEEVEIGRSIKLCGERLGYVHFSDSNRRYPGAGHTDFKEIVNALLDINYRGSISLECLPLPDNKTAALQGIRNIRKFFLNSEK